MGQRSHLLRFRKSLLIIVDPPNVDHKNTSLGNKPAFIPSILGSKMIRPELIHEPPSHDFLDHRPDIRQLLLVIKGRCSIRPDYTV